MKTLRLLSFATGLALIFSGCTGPTGPEGAPGPAGSNGLDGNANVVSQLFTVQGSGAWTSVSGPTTYFYYVQLPVNALTAELLSAGGAVSAFVSFNNTSWNAIPYTEVVGANLTANWTTNAAVGELEVNYAFSNNTLVNDPSTEYAVSNIYFNVVCIAPSIMKKHPNTNWHNYYEVQSVLNAENVKTVTQ